MIDIVSQFTEKFLQENDFKYCGPNIPVSPKFRPDVENIVKNAKDDLKIAQVWTSVESIITSISTSVLSTALYDYIRTKYYNLRLRRIQERPVKQNRPIHLVGQSCDDTVLVFGKVRPFFKVSKGNILILENLTIQFSGTPVHFFEVEEAPSIVIVNVDFIQID